MLQLDVTALVTIGRFDYSGFSYDCVISYLSHTGGGRPAVAISVYQLELERLMESDTE